jgi:mono/diheme cytochrome c family protein
LSDRFTRVAGAALVSFTSAAALAGGITTRDGAFTTAQAERGKAVYEQHCVSCHQVDFYETKLLVWHNASVGELFEALSATMPSANPGGLASGQYLDVLAYIFSITGSPAGDEELAMSNMNAIEIVAPAVASR